MSNSAPAILLAPRPEQRLSRPRTRAELAQQVGRRFDDPVRRARVLTDIWRARTDADAFAMGAAALGEIRDQMEGELDPLRTEHARLTRLESAMGDVMPWLSAPLRLETVTAGSLHKIGPQNTVMFTVKAHPLPPEIAAAQSGSLGVFLVEHDWAKLLAGTETDSGGYRLPFDHCCFEFQISGRHVCALVVSDNGEPYRMIPIIRATGGWVIVRSIAISDGGLEPEGEEPRDPISALEIMLAAQVRAIAITLDAEVVVTEVVRAPSALNVARLRRNERPIYDHHILRLTRRPRPLPPPESGQGSRKRLHFRRGHWRRYPRHKTWIRWCLAGDPSLGFADKDYRL